jgi:opacity protein-like surface antigen
MRRFIIGLAGLLASTPVFAADYLRGGMYENGPAASYEWSGIYVGAQAGYATADMGYRGSLDALVQDTRIRAPQFSGSAPAAMADTFDVPGRSVNTAGYGAFVGYNSQWGEAVIGLELNYSRTGLSVTSSDTRFEINPLTSVITDMITKTVHSNITDYGTLRARAGYAFGWFMPYAHLGVAVGRMDYTKTVDGIFQVAGGTIAGPGCTADALSGNPALRCVGVHTKRGAFIYGYSGGLGVDIGLFPGVFLRGEWEYVQFNDLDKISSRLNNFRVAAAVKF